MEQGYIKNMEIINIEGVSLMINLMELAGLFAIMGKSMMDNGKMVNMMVKENINGLIIHSLQDNL